MSWDPDHQRVNFNVQLGDLGQESFQILVNNDSNKRLYPPAGYESFPSGYDVMGPLCCGVGQNWIIGKHAFDKGAEGRCYKIRLRLHPDGSARDIDWVRLDAMPHRFYTRCRSAQRPTFDSALEAPGKHERVTPQSMARAIQQHVLKAKQRQAPAVKAEKHGEEAAQPVQDVEAAMQWYSQRIAEQHGEGAGVDTPEAEFEEPEIEDPMPSSEVRAALERDLSAPKKYDQRLRGALREAFETAEDSDGEEVYLCCQCGLPVGDFGYARSELDSEGALVHGECMAQLMVEDLQKVDKGRLRKEAAQKKKRREEYDIGWKVERIPRNLSIAKKLSCCPMPQGMCCLVLQDNMSVRIAPTLEPAAAVNLPYLALALQVRLREGREPRFSLDPVGPKKKRSLLTGEDLKASRQEKRFEPAWLAGTSVGEVMFQADYLLKELSMGEYEQPIVGMKSCFDLSESEDSEWTAREWFVVRDAAVHLSQDNVLIPCVKMGVEAREQAKGPDGWEDKVVTRPDHPLVRYADAFTERFDLIAERKSAIFHLRELAKASLLAKYLLEAKICLEGAWFSLADEEMAPCGTEIPQLWNEHLHSQIRVQDGAIEEVGCGTGSMYGLYGGVELDLDRFTAAPLPMRPQQPVVARGYGRQVPAHLVDLARKGGLPKGVDLNLDKFDVEKPEEGVWDSTPCLSPDAAPLNLGDAFWTSLSTGSKSALQGQDKSLLRAVFNPKMSDRRDEGDRFIPPNTNSTYMQKLRDLVMEEEAVLKQRKDHFFSADFSMHEAGPLFPSTWASKFKLTTRGPGGKEATKGLARGLLKPRVDYKAEAAVLEQVLKTASPVFDQSTEDGIRFRIYSIGSLEVRTTQEQDGAETIGAVFSVHDSMCYAMMKDLKVSGLHRVVKVTEYVEGVHETEQLRRRYYVVLETELGAKIVTEKLDDGTVAWKESPADLDVRNSLARVLCSADCSTMAITVKHMKSYQLVKAKVAGPDFASQSSCKRYAHGAYTWANGEARFCRFQVEEAGQWQQCWTADWGRRRLASPKAAPASDEDLAEELPGASFTEMAEMAPCAECLRLCPDKVAWDGRRYCNECWFKWDAAKDEVEVGCTQVAAEEEEEVEVARPAAGAAALSERCIECGRPGCAEVGDDGQMYCEECWLAWDESLNGSARDP